MRPLNIAIVGFGYWGPNHARIVSQSKKSKLCYIIDKDSQALKLAKLKYPNTTLTTSLAKALNDKQLDCVIIASPTSTHAKIAKLALRYGKHVFIEKPIATRLLDAQQMINLASHNKKILAVGHIYLFNPAVTYLKHLITSGQLGQILYCSAVRTNLGPLRDDVNALWDLSPHDISTLLYLLKSKVRTVTATTGTYISKKLADVAFLNLTFQNGIMANIHVSWLDPARIRTLTIVGSKKMVIFNDDSQDSKITILKKSIGSFPRGESFAKYLLQLRDIQRTTPKIKNLEPLEKELDHFFECIISNSINPINNGSHAMEVLKVLLSADKSIKSKRTIIING